MTALHAIDLGTKVERCNHGFLQTFVLCRWRLLADCGPHSTTKAHPINGTVSLKNRFTGMMISSCCNSRPSTQNCLSYSSKVSKQSSSREIEAAGLRCLRVINANFYVIKKPIKPNIVFCRGPAPRLP